MTQTMSTNIDEASTSTSTGGTTINQNAKQGGGESIHSGHFMISHFDSEAQEDDDNYLEPNDEAKDEAKVEVIPVNTITEIQTYIPPIHSRSIETSLANLFKCMELAYRQKLSSPKWNHFKGIRLRWKDKIRLNNLIWRCWHMQFIMKNKMPGCQFASPLDVDIHNKPETVVLEGKYWKRQTKFIVSEYKKWRKFYSNRLSGKLPITDNIADCVESPYNNYINSITKEELLYTSELLIRSIGQWNFPDSREISRGVGRADFIQPSLESLEPTTIENMDVQLDLLYCPRSLPPVPEEESEDLFKSFVWMDSNISEITNEQAIIESFASEVTSNNSGSLIGVVNNTTTQQIPAIQRNNLINNNTNNNNSYNNNLSNNNNNNSNSNNSTGQIQYTGDIFIQEMNSPVQSPPPQRQQQSILNQQQLPLDNPTSMCIDPNLMQQQQPQPRHVSFATNNAGDVHFDTDNLLDITTQNKQQQQQQQQTITINKTHDYGIKGKFSRPNFRHIGRRDTHIYDKTPPTPHQTIVYKQVMEQQQQLRQQQQQQQQSQVQVNALNDTATYPHYSTIVNLLPSTLQHTSPIQTTTNNYNANSNTNNNYYLIDTLQQQQQQQQHQINSTTNIQLQNMNLISSNIVSPTQTNSNQPQQQAILTPMIGAIKTEQAQEVYNLANNYQNTQQQNITYNTYLTQQQQQLQQQQQQQHQQQQQQFNIVQQQQNNPTQFNYRQTMRHPSPPGLISSSIADQKQVEQQQQQTKEMIRSQSLPINATLQQLPYKDETFAKPKYQAKSRTRTRSNSMVMKNQPFITGMHSAMSDPSLNNSKSALLTQLLTNNTLINNKQSVSSSAISPQTNLLFRNVSSPSTTVQVQQQQQQSGANMGLLGQTTTDKQMNKNNFPAMLFLQSPSTSPPRLKSLSLPPTTITTVSAVAAPTASPTIKPLLSPNSPYDQDEPMSPTLTNNNNNTSTSSSNNNSKYTNRRVGHIHAEQKRRYNIKHGFELLHTLIPQLQQNANTKLSKAAMLQKGAEYIKQLKIDRNAISEQMDALRKERDALNNSLSHLQSALPANGGPVSRQRTGRIKEMYQKHVYEQTKENWKFWIFGLIFEPFLDSFNANVSVTNVQELYRTAQSWVNQHCSLIELRPAVSNKLRYLSTTTDILSDPPSTLKDEVQKAMARNTNCGNVQGMSLSSSSSKSSASSLILMQNSNNNNNINS